MSSQSLKLNQKKNIPEGWKKVQIGDHFNFKNGLNKAKKFFGQGTPIINYMDVYPHPAIEEENIHGKVTLSNEELRNFDDFDFCLRIRKKGYKIIYNPFAKIIHYESPTRPQVLNNKIKKYFLKKHPFEKDSFFRYEWRNFYEKIYQ